MTTTTPAQPPRTVPGLDASPGAPVVVPASPSGPGAPSSGTSARTVAAMVVTVVLWASAFVGIRAVGHDVAPGPLTLGRVAVGSAALTVLLGVVALRRRRSAARTAGGAPSGVAGFPRGRLLALVAAWGVAWFGFYNLALNAAEQHLDAGTTALLVGIAPVLVALLAGSLLGEGFPRRLLVGMAAALAGVVVIAVSTPSGRFDVAGVLLGLAAAVLYAGSATLQKRLLPHLDALTMTWLGCLAGTVAALPFLPALVDQLADARPSAVLGIVYLGVFPTAIAFTTWAYVLRRTTAGRTAAATYAVPPLTVLLSWAALGEVPQAAALAGGAVALAGVAVATLPRRRAARPA
ncbi:drug/metabolite transporter (DMT)-like permease [Isoptericola jiangsuensis]|uniref:Drug/metabolite transporter (DMT)-like permease n=1 Tax=Isoptericola jiangsuensis TaxID=548579 RepID=A0A2A9EYN0_9MICO|nr:EamA family transporter [Isoptericola jiangsuensis]PFG44174.1 drug/metabolite transporter (DMT)-like permease [Isoptericola jiangsuensis]